MSNQALDSKVGSAHLGIHKRMRHYSYSVLTKAFEQQILISASPFTSFLILDGVRCDPRAAVHEGDERRADRGNGR